MENMSHDVWGGIAPENAGRSSKSSPSQEYAVIAERLATSEHALQRTGRSSMIDASTRFTAAWRWLRVHRRRGVEAVRER